MQRSPALHWLTALALLLGQWGMLAHASEHPLEGLDDALCVVCLQGHSLEQMQHSASVAIQFTQTAFVTTAQPPLASIAAAAQQPNIRGPPHSLQN
jgi:hypothetical protein